MTEKQSHKWEENITGLPEQKEAITSTAALTVVSAGAGTGKTHTLSQRYAWILASDKECKVENILVLTFTEKAAREMQERIVNTVGKWYKNSPDELSHLREAVSNMQNASISTIHAFAMKIIRESGLLLDIDPSAGIVPDSRETVWWKEFEETIDAVAYERFIRYFSKKNKEDKIWIKRIEELFTDPFVIELINNYGAGAVGKATETAYEKLSSFNLEPEALWNHDENALNEEIENNRKKLVPLYNEFFELFDNSFVVTVTEMESKGVQREEFIALYNEYADKKELTPEECIIFFRRLLDGAFSRFTSSKFFKYMDERCLEFLGTGKAGYRDAIRECLAFAEAPSKTELRVEQTLNRIAAVGWQCWENIKKNESLLSMNDLIKYAGIVLDMDESFSERYKYILIDEFQDTDEVQNSIITSLWKEDKNKLFVVGDLKQSIYRFRYANLKIFQKYISAARNPENKNYKYVTLDKSFRSCRSLLDDFNTVFSDIWADGLEKGSDMRYEPLMPPVLTEEDIRNRSCEQNRTEFITAIQNKDDKENIDHARMRMFVTLAEKFSSLHGELDVWDSGSCEFRKADWKDFAVLVPSRNVYGVMEKAFDMCNIPFVFCENKSYFSHEEVLDIVNLISLLADTNDAYYWFAWINSPYSGVSEADADEMSRLYYEMGRSDSSLSISDFIKENFNSVWCDVDYKKRNAELNGIYPMLLEFMSDQKFLCYFAPKYRKQVNANLLELAAIAKDYQSSIGKSLVLCASYLRYVVNNAIKRTEPEIYDEGYDAVKILTIHASKGLEYPVVALTGLEESTYRSDSLGVSEKYGIVVFRVPPLEGEKNDYAVSGKIFNSNEKEAEFYEKLRLWYVGATRARDKLLLCVIEEEKKKKNTDDPESFYECIKRLSEEEKIKTDRITADEEITEINHKKKSAAEKPPMVIPLDEEPDGLLGRISASAYSMLDWCPYAYRTYYRQGEDSSWMYSSISQSGGALFGTLAHKLISKWDFAPESIELLIPEEGTTAYDKVYLHLKEELKEPFASAGTRSILCEIFVNLANSEYGRKMKSLIEEGNVKREIPFRVKYEGQFLVGASDIFWEDEEKLYIRDWKTGDESIAPDGLYFSQLEFYAFALYYYRKLTGLPFKKIEIGLNYIRDGKNDYGVHDLNEDELIKIGENLKRLSVMAVNGSFECKYENCDKCPWQKNCRKYIKTQK